MDVQSTVEDVTTLVLKYQTNERFGYFLSAPVSGNRDALRLLGLLLFAV